MAQSKSRKLVTGTISAAVIASALAPVAASASVKAPNVKSATVTGVKQIKVVFTNGVTKNLNLPYRFKAGSTVTSFKLFGHNYTSVKLSTPYAPKVTSAVALNEKSIKVVFENGETEIMSLPYRFKDGSTETSFTFAKIIYKSVKLDKPYVASVNSIGTLDDININQGDDASKVLPVTVKEMLSNGTSKDVKVTWDTTKLDVNTPATYALTGKVDGTDKIAHVNVIVKAVAPQVTSVSAINGKQLLVKFNKAVDPTTAEEIGNYITSGTSQYHVSSAVVQSDNQSVLLTLDNAVPNTTSATFGLTVSGVALASDTTQNFPVYSGTVTVNDTTAPTVTSVTSSTSSNTSTGLTINFSKPVMGGFTVKVDGVETSHTLSGDGLSATVSGLSLDASKSHTVEVIGFSDASGNINSYQSTNFNVTKDGVAPVITSVTPSGDHQLLVTFSKAMPVDAQGNLTDLMGNSVAANFAVKDESLNNLQSNSNGVMSVVSTDTTKNTQFLVTLNSAATSNFYANSATRNITLVTTGTLTGGHTITDLVGNTLADTVKSVTLTKDTSAPSVVGVTVHHNSTSGLVDSITVQYNKSVTGPSAAVTNLDGSGIEFVDANGVLQSASLANNSGNVSTTDSTKVVYTVSPSSPIASYTGKYSVSVPGNLFDTALTPNASNSYNTVVDFGAAATTGTFGIDAVDSTTTPDTLVAYFHTPVKGGATTGSATQLSNYTINGQALPAGTVITLNSAPETYKGVNYAAQQVATIVLPTGTIANDDSAAVLRANGITALNGETMTPYVNPVTVQDNTAPVLQSAQLLSNGSGQAQFILTFNENMGTLASGAKVDDELSFYDNGNLVTVPANGATASNVAGYQNKVLVTVNGTFNSADTLTVKTVSNSTNASTVTLKDASNGHNKLADGVTVTATN